MSNFIEIFRSHAGPPVNIEGIISALGIQLDKKANLDSEISGQIERLDDGKFKISVNKNDHYYRQRFTMAHELGHFLIHAHLLSDGVDDNRAYRSTPEGQFYNRNIDAPQETEANRFAASILMPANFVKKHWENDISKIAKLFQVSKQAMEIRLKGLGLLS